MKKSGFEGHAASTAVRSLLANDFFQESWSRDDARLLSVTEEGMEAVLELMDKNELPVHAEDPRPGTSYRSDVPDDLPF